MSWSTERSAAGKRPWSWIEIAVNRCRHSYGDAAAAGSPTVPGCQAVLGVSGTDKCYNSWETCQDKTNFDPREYWLRLCEPVADMPRVFDFSAGSPVEDEGIDGFIPLLEKFTHDPTMPDPGESLGLRVRFTATLQDAPHHDIGIDKYALERLSGAASSTAAAHDPMTRGTLLRKLKARFPHYVGRGLRWYQGYITDSPSLADFRKREYIIERFEGPDASGRVSIVANDILRLLDDERAQAPAKSTGELVAAMTAAESVSSISIDTDDPTEYDLKAGETADYVRIGDEIFTYTGTSPTGSPDTSGVLLTGVTRAAPSPYSTTAAAHNAGDLVQRCRFFRGTVANVVEEIMVDYAGIPARFIPTTDWTDEANTWASESIERLVTEPEGVRALITEIIQQTLTWGFWWDEIDQEIKYMAVRPADVDDDIPELTDNGHIVAGSVQVMDLAEKIVNEVQVLYGQIDPVQDKDDVENYRRGLVDVNADSQSENESGQRRIKRVLGVWHPASNDGVVNQFARRTVNARSKTLVEVQFKLERKDENVRTAQFCDLTTIYLLNALGVAATTRVQVLQVKAEGEAVLYRARESFFRESFGRLAPAGGSPDDTGITWTQATEAQRERYMFLAQANGTFTNGDRGKALA